MNDKDNAGPVDDRIAKDARDWVVRLTSGTMTDAELSRFKAWRDASQAHARAFAKERVFWQQLDALDDLSGTVGGRRTGKKAMPAAARAHLNRRGFLVGGGAIAAGAAGLVVVPRLQLLLGADHRTAPGEMRDVTLSDGTRVTLNTDSALALDFRPGLRRVDLLQGEVLFEVRTNADALFRVTALGHNVDSIGTTFAVRAIDGRGAVTVSEGLVRVSGLAAADAPSSSGAFVNLRAREQTQYLKGGEPARASAVDLEAVLAWRSGRIVLDAVPFSNALAELSRYVPERVVLASRGPANEPVSAIFSTRDVSNAIATLAQTQGLNARRIPGVMILIS